MTDPETPAETMRRSAARMRERPYQFPAGIALPIAKWLDEAAQAWDEGIEWDAAEAVALIYLGEALPERLSCREPGGDAA